MYCLKNLLYFFGKSIVLFWHYQKSLDHKISQQTFPIIIQNWKRLRKHFPVYFKYIVWKIDSYLRKLQTSSNKSIVLFQQKSKITEPKKLATGISHYNSELEKTQKTLPTSFKCIVWKVDSYLKKNIDIKQKIYYTFSHYKKSLS